MAQHKMWDLDEWKNATWWDVFKEGETLDHCWSHNQLDIRIGRGEVRSAMRISYELRFGKDFLGVLRHTCRHGLCVNPHHMTTGGHVMAPVMDDPGYVSSGRMVGAARVKLNYDIAQEIRDNYTEGDSVIELAKRYGVDTQTMWNVVKGVSWKRRNATVGRAPDYKRTAKNKNTW